MQSKYFILLFLGLLCLAALIQRDRGKLKGIDRLFGILVAITFVNELITFNMANNHAMYLSYMPIALTIYCFIFYRETHNKYIFIPALAIIYTESALMLFTDKSLLSQLTGSDKLDNIIYVQTNQLFDLLILNGFFLTIFTFYWIWYIVSKSNYTRQKAVKRYIYAFSILLFYGGTFFVIAFSKILQYDYVDWAYAWGLVFKPLYYTHYGAFLIAMLWKE